MNDITDLKRLAGVCLQISKDIDAERAREKALQERDADLAYELSALMDHEHPEQVHALSLIHI